MLREAEVAVMLLRQERDRPYASDAIFVSTAPTAAPEPEQPTSLSSPLVLPSPTLRALRPLAHISDTTSTSLGRQDLRRDPWMRRWPLTSAPYPD